MATLRFQNSQNKIHRIFGPILVAFAVASGDRLEMQVSGKGAIEMNKCFFSIILLAIIFSVPASAQWSTPVRISDYDMFAPVAEKERPDEFSTKLRLAE